MTRRRLAMIALPVAALLAASGGAWWAQARHFETTDNAYVAADTAIISPRIEGYVGEILVRDNQAVSAGDVLLIIEDRDYRARVAQAEARVAAAEAALANIGSRLALEESLIAKANADVLTATAERTRAAGDLKRYQELVKRDFASEQRFASARADASKAEAAAERARAGLEAERRQVGVLQTEQAQQQAALSEAKAALELAQADLDKTVLRAPVDGVIGNNGARVGQLVRPGTQRMAVVPVNDVYVTAIFKETQLAGIRPGQRVTVTVDAFRGLSIDGTVDSLAPASGAEFSLLPPENATGNFTKIVQRVPVRIALPAGARLTGGLRPGLSVEVSVDTRGGTLPAQLAQR